MGVLVFLSAARRAEKALDGHARLRNALTRLAQLADLSQGRGFLLASAAGNLLNFAIVIKL